MDNDDALSRNHLATVQRTFKRQKWQFVLFPFGVQLFRGHLYGICWLDNPFFSLIEKVGKSGDVSTVLCCRHGDIYKTGPVRRLWRAPQWLEVIHRKNVSNSLRGWPKFLAVCIADFLRYRQRECQRTHLSSGSFCLGTGASPLTSTP